MSGKEHEMKSLMFSTTVCAIMGMWQVAAGAKTEEPGKIRVVVIDGQSVRPATARLKKMGFLVTQIPLEDVKWGSLSVDHVVVLPTQWAEARDQYRAFQDSAPRLHDFVKKGGGLVVCQPNPFQHEGSICSPHLLPYPMTFHNWYDEDDAQRVNATHAHYITEDIKADDLPFPADKVLKWDERYKILALGARSKSPSLLVCTFGKGRVVVQTGNENPESKNPFTDKVFGRMIIWAASKEPNRFRSADGTEKIHHENSPDKR